MQSRNATDHEGTPPVSTDGAEDSSVKPRRNRKRGFEMLEVIDPGELEGGRSAKRRAAEQVQSTGVDAKVSRGRLTFSLHDQKPQDVKIVGSQLWTVMRDHKHEGRVLSPVFMKLPSEKLFPDYCMRFRPSEIYRHLSPAADEIIKKPISMEEIKTKLDQMGYAKLEDVRDDFQLMFNNAKRYNMPESMVYEDARHLHKFLRAQVAAMTEQNVAEDASADAQTRTKQKIPTLRSWLQQKFDDITYYQDSSGRYLSEVFMDLPDRNLYPDYYEIIPQPMSFNVVQDKIKRKVYSSEKSYMQDVKGIFANAKYYNEERSQIWRDAASLERIFADMMREPPPDFAALAAQAEREDAPKLKVRLGGGQSADSFSGKITLKLGSAPPPNAAHQMGATLTRATANGDQSLSPGTLADVSALEPTYPAPAPQAAPAPPLPQPRARTPQPPLPQAAPRIVRDRVVAGFGSGAQLSALHVRMQPSGSELDVAMSELRQHAILLEPSVETVEIAPVGSTHVRVVSRPSISIASNFDAKTSRVIFVARPSPADALTTVEFFVKRGAEAVKEEVYRLFLQRVPI